MQLHADLGAAGEGHPVDLRVAGQGRPQGASLAVQHLEDSGRQAGGLQGQIELVGAPGRLFARLQQDGVPRQEGRARHPRRQGHGEVEGRDHDEDAVGPEAIAGLLVGREAAERTVEAARFLDLRGVVTQEIGGFFDVTQALEAVLADFVGHDRRQTQTALGDQIRSPAQAGHPLLPGPVGPGLLRRARGGDSLVQPREREAVRPGQDEAGIDRRTRRQEVPARDLLAGQPGGELAAELRANRVQGSVELTVQLGHVGV
ncbi:hypothetical protein D3C86_1509750 [compost metagenome]